MVIVQDVNMIDVLKQKHENKEESMLKKIVFFIDVWMAEIQYYWNSLEKIGQGVWRHLYVEVNVVLCLLR